MAGVSQKQSGSQEVWSYIKGADGSCGTARAEPRDESLEWSPLKIQGDVDLGVSLRAAAPAGGRVLLSHRSPAQPQRCCERKRMREKLKPPTPTLNLLGAELSSAMALQSLPCSLRAPSQNHAALLRWQESSNRGIIVAAGDRTNTLLWPGALSGLWKLGVIRKLLCPSSKSRDAQAPASRASSRCTEAAAWACFISGSGKAPSEGQISIA